MKLVYLRNASPSKALPFFYLGKTLIGAEAISKIGCPSLFFVPTIPLVAQQAAAIRCHLPNLVVGEFSGECTLPEYFNVLVTTPKAFEMAQSRGVPSLSWQKFKVVLFDEVHHAIKDHPYRNLALKLMQSNANPRVIGLTASLTYAVGDDKIKKSVGKLCQELKIDKIETASIDELSSSGYAGARRGSIAEIRLPERTLMQNLVPLEDRKPHLMHKTFFDRIKKGCATSFSTKLVDTIRVLEDVLTTDLHDFKSPLPNVSLKTWGECAKKQSSRHTLFPILEHFYEALRLLVVSWEENEDVTMTYLQMMQADSSVSMVQPRVTSAIKSFFDTQKLAVSRNRFSNLYEVLQEKIQDHMQDFRCILFVKQKVTTHILKHAIENSDLGSSIKAECIYSTKTPATASLSVTKQASKDALEAFRAGSSNMLIATQVAEEGLDIPAANCVIYFDPMDHAVSYVQGRGRARQAESSFVMLSERVDRPASMLARQETQQHAIASCFAPKKSTSSNESNELAQKSRERGASMFLLNPTEAQSLANLNIYCKKTKAALEETTSKIRGSGDFSCKLIYRSVTKNVSSSGIAPSKKKAKRVAAIEMIKALYASNESS